MNKQDTLLSYSLVYLALLVLLGLTVWVAHLNLAPFNAAIAILVAAVKTVLVLAYFMHARRGGWFIWMWVLVGFFFVALLIGLTLSDYHTRL